MHLCEVPGYPAETARNEGRVQTEGASVNQESDGYRAKFCFTIMRSGVELCINTSINPEPGGCWGGGSSEKEEEEEEAEEGGTKLR